ncbi:MAG: YceI family protein [Verrucomicrobiae bacterium]|nr:YceI family protein [Verrucomicrobiae bacterium]
MRKIPFLPVCAAMLLTLPTFGAVESYEIDPAHSSVGFKIRHLMSKVPGKFNDFSGKLVLDPEKPEASSVEATIQVKSIDTANADRDKHLRAEDFFDVAKFPVMTFKSKKVVRTGPESADVTGDLTLRGVTREVTLKVQKTGQGKDPWGNIRTGWEATAVINRLDYGVKYNKLVEGSNVLGDDVEISILIEAIQKK